MGSTRGELDGQGWPRSGNASRRYLLAAVGCGAVAAFAGCLGSDAGNPTYEDGEVGDVDGEERSTEEATAAEAHAEQEINEAVTPLDGLELGDHEFVLEDGFERATVQGSVENGEGSRIEVVEVRVRVFGDGGEQLGRYIARTGDLDDGDAWGFQVILLEAPEDIADYDIAALGTPT